MTVIKSKRHESEMEFIHTARELRIYTTRKVTGFPKRYTFTVVVKLSHGFTFLKARLYLTETGRVIRKIPRQSVTRARRKLKKLARFLDAGKLTYNDVYTSFQSWRAYAMNFDSWNTIQSMSLLFNTLFVWPQGGVTYKAITH